MWRPINVEEGSPLNPLHTRPQCQCFHLPPGPKCFQLFGGLLLFLAASQLMAATTLVLVRQMPAHCKVYTHLAFSAEVQPGSWTGVRLNYSVRSKVLLTLFEHMLLEREAVNFSWGWEEKNGEVLRRKFSFQKLVTDVCFGEKPSNLPTSQRREGQRWNKYKQQYFYSTFLYICVFFKILTKDKTK